jgi:hypothetical protein
MPIRRAIAVITAEILLYFMEIAIMNNAIIASIMKDNILSCMENFFSAYSAFSIS